MDLKKILIITASTIIIIGLATVITTNIKPKMHKNIILENIIFIRSK